LVALVAVNATTEAPLAGAANVSFKKVCRHSGWKARSAKRDSRIKVPESWLDKLR
jgi:hypothetical protein